MSKKKKDRVEELNARFIEESQTGVLKRPKKRWFRRKITRRRLIIALPLFLLISAVAAQNLYEYYGPGSCHSLNPFAGSTSRGTATRVGLIDTLAYEYPDNDFVQSIGSTARATGMGFDYYTPHNISLDTFVHLPLDGFSILILRTHIGYSNTTATALQVAITTSEPYDNYRWVSDQVNDRLTDVEVNGSFYFGLTPLFVADRMCGQFPGTLVLAMGCYALNSTSIGEALIHKGASAFIGWKGVVRVDQTDLAFEELLPLLLDGHSIDGAIRQVMGTGEVAPGDPELSYLQNSQ